MTVTADSNVDSPEGIAHLIAWARAHGMVLNQAHEEIAKKHGVSTEGVTIARPMPTVLVQVGPDVVVFRDANEAVVLVGRSLKDIDGGNVL